MRSEQTRRIKHLVVEPEADAETRWLKKTRALGLELEPLRNLEAAIMDDLTDQPPYGVHWWQPQNPTKRRLLVSDHLYASAHSLSTNLIEAQLHLLEFQDFAERIDASYANSIQMNRERLVQSPRESNCVHDELDDDFAELHACGTVRSLGSALDCLAAAVIGVLALPLDIFKAQFGQVRKHLSNQNDHMSLEAMIESAGPSGWLDWTLDYRNMLVHRGRRIQIGQIVPKNEVLFGPDWNRIPRARHIRHLPADPGRSDVSVFHEGELASLVLTEDWLRTLEGLAQSTVRLVREATVCLFKIWNDRRISPKPEMQPLKYQWPKVKTRPNTVFSGYAPGEFRLEPDLAWANPSVAKRFRSAVLDDASRTIWASLDD